jgi:hypothetical protein
MESQHLHHLSTGELTYWPSDTNKLPDLVDFCVTKGIPPASAVATSCFHLSSDHSPVLITIASHALPSQTPLRLSNHRTNWNLFQHLITERLTLNIPLKTPADIEEAVKTFTDTTLLSFHTTVLPSSNASFKKKEDFASDGIDTEPQRTNDSSTKPQGTSNNFSYSTGMIAFRLSCKALHRLRPLTTPCGKRPSD